MSFITSPGVIVPPLTAGGVAYGTGGQAKVNSAGTAGQVLRSAGAGVPTWATSTAGIPVTVPEGGTGLTTLTQNNVILGNGVSTPSFVAPGASGNLLTSNGSTWASAAAPAVGFTLATPVASTSGTAINFTGIPTGVKQIIVSLVGVTMSAAGGLDVRIGTSAGVLSTGYSGTQARVSTTTAYDGSSSGFGIYSTTGMGELKGSVIITLENATTNTWSAVLSIGTANFLCLSAGTRALPGVLDRVQLTADGVATFNGGAVNIAYI